MAALKRPSAALAADSPMLIAIEATALVEPQPPCIQTLHRDPKDSNTPGTARHQTRRVENRV